MLSSCERFECYLRVEGAASLAGRLSGTVEGTMGFAGAASRFGRAAAAVVSCSLPRLSVTNSGTTTPDERVFFVAVAAFAAFFLGGIFPDILRRVVAVGVADVSV